MPICTVCEGDGVIQVGTIWYCLDHLEEAFMTLARFMAVVRGWDVTATETGLRAWLEE